MKHSISSFEQMKAENCPIAMITAYDFPFARLAEEANADIILVGDSLANVMWGHQSTRDIGMEELLVCTAAVRRGAPDTFVVADMPWESDHQADEARKNALALVEAGADAVKIEGNKFASIEAVLEAGVPVVGHLGLTPQTAANYKQHGKTPEEALQIQKDALRLQELGCFMLVLEHIPDQVGAEVTQSLKIPTIGIGAGNQTSGQVMVLHDILGLGGDYVPPIAKRFADVGALVRQGMQDYVQWVRERGGLK